MKITKKSLNNTNKIHSEARKAMYKGRLHDKASKAAAKAMRDIRKNGARGRAFNCLNSAGV